MIMKHRALLLLFLIGVCSLSHISQSPPSHAAGVQAFRSADYAKAINLFKKAVKENKNDAPSWYWLGTAYLKKGKLKDGVKAMERAVQIDPKRESRVVGLALAYMLSRNSKAQATARQALELNPKNVDAHYLLGQIAIQNGSFNIAYERANKVIELNPNHAAAHRLKGEALLGSFAAQSGTIIKPPGNRNDLLIEASTEFEKFLSLVTDQEAKKELQDQIESFKAFAEYFGREKNSDRLELDPVPDPGKVPLKILAKPHASYTDNSRQGTVQLLVALLADGKIGNILMMKPTGSSLDQAAVEAARQIKFTPESKNGNPVTVVRLFEYIFSFR